MPISGDNNGIRPIIRRQGDESGPPPTDSGPSIEEAMREAETRGLDFPATERAVYVNAMIKRVAEYKSAGRNTREIRELLPEFVRDYPYLFDMVTQEGGYDAASLRTMLTMLEKMGEGQINHHQATVIVGQRLAQKYIDKQTPQTRRQQ